MQTNETQLLEYIIYEVSTELSKALSLGAKWFGVNIKLLPSERKGNDIIVSPNVETYWSKDKSVVEEYAKNNGWKTYKISPIEEVMQEFKI